MAEVAVPSISTVVPTDADTVVGVQTGAVKRFVVGNLRLPSWTTAAEVIVAADGNKLWLAKYKTGSGHTDAPKTLGATSTYLQVGGREYGSAGFSGIGFGYVADATQNPCVWVGHEERDTGGNTTGDFVVATRNVTTNTAPIARLRVTKDGQTQITNDGQDSGAAAALTVSGSNANGPAIGIGNTSQGVDGKWWDIMPVASGLHFRTVNDAGSASKDYMQVARTANAVTSVTFGNTTDNPSYLWAGNGPWTINGQTGQTGMALMSSGNAAAPTWSAVSAIVSGSSRTAQAANVSVSNFYTIPVGGLYRVSAYVVLSQAATTSSMLPSASVSYTEAVTGAAVQDMITSTAGTNIVGLHSGGSVVIQAQQGSNLSYITSNYASSGATPMQYSVHLTVERIN